MRLRFIIIYSSHDTTPHHHIITLHPQTIIDGDIPDLPSKPARLFSSQFQAFLKQCMRKEPEDRPTAETLLQSPWLVQNGATSAGEARNLVFQWIQYVTNEEDEEGAMEERL
jgi:serine/threonine protein kinase